MNTSKKVALLIALMLAGPLANAGAFVYRLSTPGSQAEAVLPPAPQGAPVVRVGKFNQMYSVNLTTGNLTQEGNTLIGHSTGGIQFANVATGSVSTAPIVANFSSYGFPSSGNVEVRKVHVHPTNPQLLVVVGDYSVYRGANGSFAALAKRNGEFVAAKYVQTNGISADSTMAGNTLYVQAASGQSGAMTCSVQALDITCASSTFAGISPTTDASGVLHVRYFSMYGNNPMQIVTLNPSAPNPNVRRSVTGLPTGVAANMQSIAFGRDGNLYATFSSSSAVWKIDQATWQVSPFAGSVSETGDQGGTTLTARFGSQLYLQKSANGLYVKDYSSRVLFEILL